MPPPKLILTPSTRATIFGPPAEREEALRRYALAPEDAALARRHRRIHNRLGFAVQLALVRDLGRPLRPGEVLPDALVEVVAEQLAPSLLYSSCTHGATRLAASMPARSRPCSG